jgi:hypothetical protein
VLYEGTHQSQFVVLVPFHQAIVSGVTMPGVSQSEQKRRSILFEITYWQLARLVQHNGAQPLVLSGQAP